MFHALPTIDGVLSATLDGLYPILQVGGVALGIIFVVMGFSRMMGPNRDSGGLFLVVIGVIGAGGAVVLTSFLRNGFGDEPASEPSPHATPSTTASREPSSIHEAVQGPADLTWLFILLGVILAVLLTAVLVWVLVAIGQRARRSVREGRERVKAELERVQRLTDAWQTFRDRHDELLRKIVHAETDWDSLFFLPALTDPNVDQTHRMLLAMRTANTLRDTAGELPSGLAADVDLTAFPYPRAVEDFAHAWDIAERHARRVGQKKMPAAERKIIKEVRTLLDVAENSAASQTERPLAYRRAQTLLKSLDSVHVPQSLMAQLEESQRLMLTTAPASTRSR
jgi:hypothetical protein